MKFVLLKSNDINSDLFKHFQRRQMVTQCWRQKNGKWIIQDEPFIDDWTPDEYEELVKDLRNILTYKGIVIGAFTNHKLKGFAAVKATLYGKNKEYLDLPYVHVSEDTRGQGTGRAMFEQAKIWAKAHGAKKLYISAHSAVESQAFYRAMGCAEAEEYNTEHVLAEPYDCQLECKL